MAIIARSVSTKFFDYNKDGKVFCAEASDLPKGFDFLGPIYDDACDSGFKLMSHKTGKEILFTWWKTDRDASGEDIAGWWFKPVLGRRELLTHGHLANVTLLIIND